MVYALKKKLHLTLQTKIIILVMIVIFASIFGTISYISHWRINEIRKETETSIMNMAKIIAMDPIVRQNLGQKNGQKWIQNYVDNILASIERVEVIVIVDMNNLRYAHPQKERIGQAFVGGDEKRVLQTGDSYVSEAEGTLGWQVRAFVPVFDYDNKQVGFVMVGQFIKKLKEQNNSAVSVMVISAFTGIFIGAIGAIILSDNIKKTLLGLEPNEITRLYIQREGMLGAMNEGVIAIDEKGNITMVNHSAIKMLQLDQENVMGRSIQDVFPSCKLMEILVSGEAEYRKEQAINNTLVVINRVPIKKQGKIAGAIATFNDKTEIKRLAEEMTGVKQVTDALRANTHEFMNKLHTILGLIDIGEPQEAKKYIMNETEKHQNVLNQVVWNIKEPVIAGLLLGKMNRAKELGIKMSIDSNSFLSRDIAQIDNSELITILGNLIENAMDALWEKRTQQDTLDVLVKEYEDKIIIQVIDNGMGIAKEDLDKIFIRGFSTKQGVRGQGLFLVKDAVENLNGKIEVESVLGEGAKFIVEIPKKNNMEKEGLG